MIHHIAEQIIYSRGYRIVPPPDSNINKRYVYGLIVKKRWFCNKLVGVIFRPISIEDCNYFTEITTTDETLAQLINESEARSNTAAFVIGRYRLSQTIKG